MPGPRVAVCDIYSVPQTGEAIEVNLASNEGPSPPPKLVGELIAHGPALLSRYPDPGHLEALLAERFGVPRDRVLVTAGADDALLRTCMAMLSPGREIVLPVPTFEMLDRYARLAGGVVVEVDWRSGRYPLEAVLEAVSSDTALVAVVSPNNPTGAAATNGQLEMLSREAPGALLLVDAAYAEFADEDLTGTALELPNALLVRTFSKAWGLAGLRVGYALGPPAAVRWLRAMGNPYAVAAPSAALAAAWLKRGEQYVTGRVARVLRERAEIFAELTRLGAEPLPSQANFVLARFGDAPGVWKSLAQAGIGVRSFPGRAGLSDCLRITCPGRADWLERLIDALRSVPREMIGTNSGGSQ